MIEPVEVVRDEDGGFTHPVWGELLDSLDDIECIPRNIILLFEKAHGCTLHYVSFEETTDEGDPAFVEHCEDQSGFSKWDLAPPSDDAVLLSIYDAEDGPYQLWAMPVVCADSIVKKLVAEYEAHIKDRGVPNETYTPPRSDAKADNFVFVSVRLLNEARRFVQGEDSHHG